MHKIRLSKLGALHQVYDSHQGLEALKLLLITLGCMRPEIKVISILDIIISPTETVESCPYVLSVWIRCLMIDIMIVENDPLVESANHILMLMFTKLTLGCIF